MQDRLGVLSAHERVVEEEIESVTRKKVENANREFDLKSIKDEMAQLGDASRKVGAEVLALNVELAAPPRVRIIDQAIAPSPRR
jgi:polysaccharide biosynthesis transport protein